MNDETNRVPIIKLWNVLLMPLQGDVSDAMMDRLLGEVLHLVRETRTTALVIDVTGLWLMDSHLCAVLARVAAAARLMGSTTVICGMSPEIAATLQSMGLRLGGVKTALALEEALEALGFQRPEMPVETGDPQDSDSEATFTDQA
jgi:rsbT antagonist protein RsbS